VQEQIARTIAALPDANGFALAGGGALVVLGVVDRPTRDLDYFGTAPEAVDRLRPALEQALRDQGLTVEVRRAVEGFVEYEVGGAGGATALDVSWDTRLFTTQQTELGAVLARDELAADKTLALFGRSEARDFVDVFRLRSHYERDDLCRLAEQKDRGFDLGMFGAAIDGIDRHDRADFPVDDEGYRAMRVEFTSWRDSIAVSLELDVEPPGLDLEP
jgi:hypothetical protein